MGMKKIFCLVLLTFLFLLAGNVNTLAIEDDEDELFNNPVIIRDGISVSIFDCVASAFKNSPRIRKQKYNLDIAKSNLGIARSQYFPVINAGAGFYNENNSDNIYYNSHYRELPTVGITVNKLVWNFGKTTAYIKMEDFYKIGAEYEFMDSLCSTLFDVKAKYYALLRAKAMLQIAQNNVEINENIVKLAKKNPDITTAKVHLSEAKIQLVDAQNNYKNAKLDLDNAMFIEGQPKYTIKTTPTFAFDNNFVYKNKSTNNIKEFTPQTFSFPMNDAVQIAYDNSPDLNVLIATKHAMEQSLLYIKRSYFPDLTANAGYNFYNTNQTTDNGFHVGVNLNSSVNIMELKHSIKGADAQVNLANNEINLFKKDLYFEVKRAFNNVEKAEKEIPIAKTEVLQSLENFDVVEKKYIAGEVNYLAMLNARRDYTSALTAYVNSLYDYNIALIQVEMAMHYHIVDIHHKSEHAMHYHSAELIEHLNKVLGCDEHEEKETKTRKDKQNL